MPLSLWRRSVCYTLAANIRLVMARGFLIANQVLDFPLAAVVPAHLLPAHLAANGLNFMMNFMTTLITWFGSRHMEPTTTKRIVSSYQATSHTPLVLSTQKPTTTLRAVAVIIDKFIQTPYRKDRLKSHYFCHAFCKERRTALVFRSRFFIDSLFRPVYNFVIL